MTTGPNRMNVNTRMLLKCNSVGMGGFEEKQTWCHLLTIPSIFFSTEVRWIKTYKNIITFLFLAFFSSFLQQCFHWDQLIVYVIDIRHLAIRCHFSSCPWQCLQCLQWGQLPSLLARAARSRSAGPSFIPRPWKWRWLCCW